MVADGVLLLGFGGVTDDCCGRSEVCPGRVRCFISKVLGDDPRQTARIDEVAAHYEHLGGTSPYNELTLAQARALEAELGLPVRCGFRNWPPWYSDGLQELAAAGCRRIILAVLAPHQTSRSWDQYLDEARQAAAELGAAAPGIVGEVAPWWNHPGFISANAGRIRAATADWSAERFAAAGLVLTAHAIPVPAERSSPYRDQVLETAALVAAAVDHPDHQVAFQSAPDSSRVPWSEPRVETVVDALADAGCRDIVLQSIGFLVDHVEVLYDLDIEVAEQCRERGVGCIRAPCVHDDPAFIACLADRIRAVC